MSDRYPQSVIDEVLARTDLVAAVSQYVQLQRKSGRFVGLCPFHSEKTPSFTVNPDRGFFYCFGCKAGGTAIDFLMKMESWSFRDALRELAERAGVELPRLHGRDAAIALAAERVRDEYLEVQRLAGDYFQTELWSEKYPSAIAYLRDRGVDPPTARDFQIGYAPEAWQGLLQALRRNNVSAEAVARSGLALPRKGGGHYDRFRDRIMFPVVDRLGRVVGFSGRALGSTDGPKYMNSPEHASFKKGEHLFGLQAAKEALRRDRRAILVEGNFDVVTLHAAGFRTALAPLGTALTTAQVALLRRLAESVVIVFDGDQAGQSAMLKAVEPCYAADLDVRGATLPPGEDPDSYVRRLGSAAFGELVEQARPLAELAFDRVVSGVVGAPIEQRVQAGRRAGQILALLPAGTVRDHYRAAVANRLDLPVAEVMLPRRTHGTRPEPAGDEEGAHLDVSPPLRLTVPERMLLQLLGEEPWRVQGFCDDGLTETVRPELRGFLEALGEEGDLASTLRLHELVEAQGAPVRDAILASMAGEWVYRGGAQQGYDLTVRQLVEAMLLRADAKARELLGAADRDEDFASARDIVSRLEAYKLKWKDILLQHLARGRGERPSVDGGSPDEPPSGELGRR